MSARVAEPLLQAEAHYIRGESAVKDGRYSDAIGDYTRALDIFESTGDLIQQGRCLRRIGDSHYFLNNLDLSMRSYIDSLRIFRTEADNSGSSQARLHAGHLMATIGNVLKESGDLKDALDYYGRCRKIYLEEKFLEGLPGVQHNIGILLQQEGRLQEALEAYEKAVEEAQASGDEYLVSIALNNIGSVMITLNDLDRAVDYLERSMKLAGELGRKKGVLSALLNMIEVQRLKGDFSEAMKLCGRAEPLAAQLEDRGSMATILKSRAMLHKAMGEYRQALETHMEYHGLWEEILSEKRIHQLDILRIRYEAEAQELEIASLRKAKAIQRKMIAGAAAGLALAGISLVSAYRNTRFRTMINRELEDKNTELEGAYSRVEKLSRTDHLTGLANRRAMMDRLKTEQARFQRHGRPFSIILCDIDLFKSYNDSYGHACGDGILVKLAGLLEAVLREQDTASRWGGEEFLILLPETGIEGGIQAARKLQDSVSGCCFRYEDKEIQVRITSGVAEGGKKPLDETIHDADTALYYGKEKGRNRVVALKAR